jgi:hypothetical protein
MKRVLPIAALVLIVGIGALVYFESKKVSQAGDGASRLPRESNVTVPHRQPPVTTPVHSSDGLAQKKMVLDWLSRPDEVDDWYNTDATFYGRVLDLEGNPVPSAEVGYTRPPHPLHNTGSTAGLQRLTKTDSDGRFSIVGYKAPSLRIAVAAAGYYTMPESTKDLSFAPLPAFIRDKPPPGVIVPVLHQPDPNNPVVFRLRKMGKTIPLYSNSRTMPVGYALITSMEHAQFVRNPQGHTVTVRGDVDRTTVRPGKQSNQPYFDWSVEISVAGGGLVERTEAEEFTAPEAGYREKIQVEFFAANAPGDWTARPKLDYYVRFPDGTFGRVLLEMSVDERGRNMGRLESWYDPSGGRYFEFDPSKAIDLKRE